MSKKILNTQPVINELRGQSVFFKQAAPSQSGSVEAKHDEGNEPKIHPPVNIEKTSTKPIPNQASSPIDLPAKKKNDTVGSSESNHANIDASTLAYIQDDIIETIRKTVKQVGKDCTSSKEVGQKWQFAKRHFFRIIHSLAPANCAGVFAVKSVS